ncbi:MAG: HAD-IC family P-type ATPase [Pseudomonadota bacterium]
MSALIYTGTVQLITGIPTMGLDKTLNHQENHWHSQTVGHVFSQTKSGITGLDDQQALERLSEFGPNKLAASKPTNAVFLFFKQFHNVLLYVLMISAVVTALLGLMIDTAVILGVLIINACIGYLQEEKAEKALLAIRKLLLPYAMAFRNSHWQQIASDQLVPGDIVRVKSGDKVAADIRLIQCHNLRVQEAILTGESFDIEKDPQPVLESIPIGERTCMAFSGTLVTYGQGLGVVVATGHATEIGKISESLKKIKPVTTPLLRKMTEFGRWLAGTTLSIGGVIFLFGTLVRGYSFPEMFLATVSLIVAAIPEGLPVVLTITMAIGVGRMAKKNAIIRHLPAVETLGSVTVICSDKTGTLTRSELTAQKLITASHEFDVQGSGYIPIGAIQDTHKKQASLTQDQELFQFIMAGLLCNDASIQKRDLTWDIQGDSMEGALLVLGMKADMDPEMIRKKFPRTDLIPFESENRFMATLNHSHQGEGYIFIKGAPETILKMCAYQLQDSKLVAINHDYWRGNIENLALQGLRTLALAQKSTSVQKTTLLFTDIQSEMILLGVVGFLDPPRESAYEAVQICHDAGIYIKMITGDHLKTAKTIADKLNLTSSKAVLSGEELAQLTDVGLLEVAEKVDVFARTTAHHKLRLVKALQKRGDIVAMTGDGVNDAPALKQADIGIAMGIKGTEAAKEAATMVLTDDKFSTIVSAVKEGRTVYDNLKKNIMFALPTSGGEALTIIAAILMGYTLPITPVQILWVNMVTAVTLGMALAFAKTEPDVMQRPPRDPKNPIISGFLVWRVIFVSLLIVTAVFGIYIWERRLGTDLATARTVAVNMLVGCEIVYLVNCQRIHQTILNTKQIFSSLPILVAIGIVSLVQVLFTYTAPMQFLFDTSPVTVNSWLRTFALAAVVFLLVELEKVSVAKLKTLALRSFKWNWTKNS